MDTTVLVNTIITISEIVQMPEYYRGDIDTKHGIISKKFNIIFSVNMRQVQLTHIGYYGAKLYIGSPLVLTYSSTACFSFYRKHVKVVRNHVTERYTYDMLPILYMNMLGW